MPLAIGGAGLPAGVQLRGDLPDAGLANVAATIFNLMGYEVGTVLFFPVWQAALAAARRCAGGAPGGCNEA